MAQLSLKHPKPFISINRVVLPLLKSNQRCCSGKSQTHRGKAGYLSCPFSGSRSFWGRTGPTVVLVSRAQNPPGGTLPFLLEPSRLPPPPPPLRLSKAWRSHLASPHFQAPVFASVTCWLQVASSSCQGASVVEQTDGRLPDRSPHLRQEVDLEARGLVGLRLSIVEIVAHGQHKLGREPEGRSSLTAWPLRGWASRLEAPGAEGQAD